MADQRRPSRAEDLVREKDTLTELERKLDMFQVQIRLGEGLQLAEEPALRRMFWRQKPNRGVQDVSHAIVHEFYAFISTRLDETRMRLLEIERELTAMEGE